MKDENQSAVQDKNEVTIHLHDPIEWGKKGLVEEIVIKAPRGKHLAFLPKDYAARDLIKVAAKASGYEEAFFGELHIKDYQAVIEATNSFLGDGQ